MPIFHDSGNRRENFKNQFRIPEKKREKFCSLSREQAGYIYNTLSLKSRYWGCWQKALDKRSIRTLTKGKVPQRKNWPELCENLRVRELLRKYEEWGARTGRKIGTKYYVIADLDLRSFAKSLWRRLEKNFLLMKSRQRIKHIKTKRGYHDIFLLDELPPNGAIYHTDKFGVRRKIGDILALGRQAQALGSPDKEEAGEGKWAWQANNIQEISKIWAKYFLEIKCEESRKVLTKEVEQKITSDISSSKEEETSSVKTSESQKPNKIYSKNTYQIVRLTRILIISRQTTKKTNCYRVNYCDQQKRRGFFFLDSYFRDKKEKIKPNLIVDLIIEKGYKYQFFHGFT